MDKAEYLKSLLKEVGGVTLVPRQKSLARESINSLPVVDTEEEMVTILKHPRIVLLVGTLSEKYPLVRKRVLLKLMEVAETLPKGLVLGVQEAFRPVEIQEQYRERKFNSLREKFPEKTREEIEKIVDIFVARAGGPHQTGGAVDVTLAWSDTLAPLDMGTEFGMPGTKSFTDSIEISWEAQVHRYLLWSYMTAVGFRNYPAEWWHYEYGTKRWSRYMNLESAFYPAISTTS